MDYIFDNERPIYLQLVEKLKAEIVSEKLKQGERLPSVRELALIARLVYTERTNGKFVTTNKELINKFKEELAKEKVINFLNDMKNIGITHEESIRYLQELGGNK